MRGVGLHDHRHREWFCSLGKQVLGQVEAIVDAIEAHRCTTADHIIDEHRLLGCVGLREVGVGAGQIGPTRHRTRRAYEVRAKPEGQIGRIDALRHGALSAEHEVGVGSDNGLLKRRGDSGRKPARRKHHRLHEHVGARMGALPNAFGRSNRRILYCSGPITNNASDLLALSEVMAKIGASVSRPLRVHVSTSTDAIDTHPAHVRAVQRVAEVLRELGHDVHDHPSFFVNSDDVMPLYGRLMADVPIPRTSALTPYAQWIRAQTNGGRPLEELRGEVDRWFGAADIWLSPTTPQPPPAIGAWSGLSPSETARHAYETCAYTGALNLSAQPAATLPVPVEGRLVGVQVAGRRDEDRAVLDVVHAVTQGL